MRFSPLIFVILITGCSATEMPNIDPQVSTSNKMVNYANNRKGIESIMSNQALKAFNTDYKKATKHKAFVQSDSAIWAFKSNKTSQEHAIKSALIACQRFNKKNEALYPCKVINVDGKWL